MLQTYIYHKILQQQLLIGHMVFITLVIFIEIWSPENQTCQIQQIQIQRNISNINFVLKYFMFQPVI